MKKFLFLAILFLPFACLTAQNITAAEYFFDTDPGTGNGIPLTVSTPGSTVNFTASISTASLSQGFHTLAIRTRSDDGVWGIYESRVLYITNFTSDEPPITAAEYFLDTDPGAGNGIPVSVGTTGNTVSFTALIPTASLPAGFHTIAFRTRNSNGVWSLYQTSVFYITSSNSDAPAITAAEFFLDTDPGAGNGTPMNIGASGNTVNFTTLIPTTSLSTGFHTLAVRTKDANNVWSLYQTGVFYITAGSLDEPAITSAEYFIDADPGAGNGLPISVGTTGNTVNFTTLIPTTSLSNGFHTLALRTRNANGVWSLYQTGVFYLSTTAADMTSVNAAEYFIDVDPGVGNGSPLTVTTPGNTINQTFLANVPVGTPLGQHFLYIRTRDANGVWSLFESRDFTVVTPPLPLNWISFTGQALSRHIELSWITKDEVNTSSFTVERSKNGIEFQSIGTVTAKGQVYNEYGFNDLRPLPGVNFYRLKQFDVDGQFKYSEIIKVYWGDKNQNTLVIYPNPVLTNLSVEFNSNEKILMIQVYDASGKIVINSRVANQNLTNIPVSHLAKGMYWIVISDGIVQQKAQFMKE